MSGNDVKVTGANQKLTAEEIKARREAFKKIQAEGHTIELTSRGSKNAGVSYDYMDRLNKDIEAGIFYDEKNDGFTNTDKRALGSEFESVFTEHGYKTAFKRMQAKEKYDITYDDYVRLAKSAGYVLAEEPKKEDKAAPAEDKKVETPVVKPAVTEQKVETPVVATPVKENNDAGEDVSVELDSTTMTDSEGNVIYEYTTGTVNGQPVKITTEGTDVAEETAVVEDNVDDADEEVSSNPFAAKKTAVEPDALPVASKPQKANPVVPEVAVPQVANEETEPAKTAAAVEPVKVTNEETEADKAPAAAEPVKGADAKEVSTPSYSEDAIAAEIQADNALAGKTTAEQLNVLREREIELSNKIRDLKQPATYRTKKFLFFGGKVKERDLTAAEQQQRQQQSEEFNAQLDEVKKYQEYVKEIGGKYWHGKYSPDSVTDENDNEVESFPGGYNRVTVVDAEGNERRAASVTTLSEPDKYGYRDQVETLYPMAVKKVGKSTYGKYWEVVPDMQNPLQGYSVKKN